jgi:hypothetical protein
MGFFMDYIRKKIEENMEDPDQRQKDFERRLVEKKKQADQQVARMTLPTKSWGFWQQVGLGKYESNMDPAIKQLPGRTKPGLY